MSAEELYIQNKVFA
jgi:hypothetical protein